MRTSARTVPVTSTWSVPVWEYRAIINGTLFYSRMRCLPACHML
eukprot:SAG31_NODE_7501_length_1670_cov_1.703374_1_plen_43_part_10